MESITCAELGFSASIPQPTRRDWRIGLIGFGSIAGQHLEAYRAAGWSVVAMADPQPEARVRAAQAGIEHCYSGYEALIADPHVEVVACLTQPSLRLPIVEACLAAGKPLLIEKPLAIDLQTAERIADLADSAPQTPIAVSQNYRWMGANWMARLAIEQGLIGRARFAGITIYGPQDRDLAQHPYYSTCRDFITVQWNNHLADLLRCWLGRDPQRVCTCTGRAQGQAFTSDVVLASFVDYGAGIFGHILHHEIARSGWSVSARIDGTEGSLVVNLWGDDLTINVPRLGDGPRQVISEVPLLPSMAGSMGDLLLAVEQGRMPQINPRQNLVTLRHVVADDVSARAGGGWTAVT